MKLIIISLTLIFCFGYARKPTSAQVRVRSDLTNRLDEIARKALSRPAAGLSIAVARDGQLIFSRGYGMANLDYSVSVTPETVFHIDSISKYIETAVLLQLVEQGKLSLEEDVRKYVPQTPTQGHLVTIKQLLNHTSGIFSFTSLPDAAENEAKELTHDQVLDLIKDKPLQFEPGAGWRYDNSGFYLAGMVIERVTKQDYGAYVREHVFEPLGMTSALLCDARVIIPHLAAGYERRGGGLVKAGLISWKLPFAAGAVCATAKDLVKWQHALDGAHVITPAFLSVMRTRTTLMDGVSIDYGLGTRFGSLDGHRALGHTGSGAGYTTVLESFPDDKLVIAVLINTDDSSATAIAAAVARAVLKVPTRTLLDLPVPAEELDAILGTYDSDEGTVELFARTGKIFVRPAGTTAEGMQLRRQTAYVYAINENIQVRFLVRENRAAWSFVYAGGLMLDAVRRVK